MIKNDVIKRINQLVKRGKLSQRQIAKNVGVSRGTVHAVAKGRRLEHDPNAMKKTSIWVIPSGRPKRCPHCGSCVRMPCLACQIIAMHQPGCLWLETGD